MGIGFGKHDSVEAIIGYAGVMDGWSNDSITFGEDSGEWAERLDGSVTAENLVSLFGADYRAKLADECSHGGYGSLAGHHGYDAETEAGEHALLISDVLESLATCAGIIVTGDSQGFVYGESYATAADLEREWQWLRQAESDLYREQVREEHFSWVQHGDKFGTHDADDCEDCAPVEGYSIGDVVNYSGVASRVVGFDSGSLIVVMVGDDARRVVDADLERLGDDYCHDCGQVGCYGDGRTIENEEG